MMCKFKPGDEVVCVDARPAPKNDFSRQLTPKLEEGRVYVVAWVGVEDLHEAFMGEEAIILEGAPLTVGLGDTNRGYRACRFRKVQRRDISQWLERATDYEEPKRKKAKA